MYTLIIKELQDKMKAGVYSVNLSEFMKTNSIEPHQLNSYLNSLQKEDLIEFTYEITTTGLKPKTIFRGVFGNIERIQFEEDYIHNFYCKLTYKGSKEIVG